ncbi:MAG TPA: hypothetical protein IAC41_10725 [Candidatus Merdenecus merdavium]|nr:hypothetical protein [Candidatus Merdenecus merdavium]
MKNQNFLLKICGILYLIAVSIATFSLIAQAANEELLSPMFIYLSTGLTISLILLSFIIEKIYLIKHPDEKVIWKNHFKYNTLPTSLSLLIAGIIYMLLILIVFIK